MNKNLKTELIAINIILIPFLYLAYIWKELPEKVPIHFNLDGEIDRYSNKIELILVPILLPLLFYVAFKVISITGIKRNVNNNQFKLILISFMTVLALFILYTSKMQADYNFNHILLFIGVFYMILGYYFKTITPNYFIGIRTPWTLKNELVWDATHKFGSTVWVIGGIIILLMSLMIEQAMLFKLLVIVTLTISILPIVYSYFKFRSLVKLT